MLLRPVSLIAAASALLVSALMLASCAQPAGEAKSPATTAGTTAGASREAPPPLLVDPSGLPDFSRLVEA